ncbi:MAG: hypothetical protein RSF40_10545 [Oscillospiraceae bacterium]
MEQAETIQKLFRATTDNARATVSASSDARENRETEQQRLATERSGTKAKGQQIDTGRSGKTRKSYDRGR